MADAADRPMLSESRIDEILDDWQAAFESGRDLSVAELCRDCPELAPEVARRLTAIRDGAAFLGRFAPGSDPEETASRHENGSDLPAFVGGYRVLGPIGAGGMGEVYRAEDPVLRREVAVKVLRAGFADRPDARDRFLREARAAASVQHDHVVPVYHAGEDAGAAFLVMQLLVGESLARRLRRGTLAPAEVIRVGREAALGLAAAHEKGLVHRDIKPSNLWLEAPTGRVRILDFGLARAATGADGVTAAGAVIGTPLYMAPEQADRRPVDARADLFSLGVVLYECATGCRVFQRDTMSGIFAAIATHDPAPPHERNPAVPAGLSALIVRLLAKNPADRPPSARAVADELATLTSPTPSGYARSRRRFWAACGFAGLLLGAGVWLATPSAPKTTPAPERPAEAPAPRLVRVAPTLARVFETVMGDRNQNAYQRYVYLAPMAEEAAFPAAAWVGFAPRQLAPGVWAFDLRDARWTEADWERVVQGYPYAFDHDDAEEPLRSVAARVPRENKPPIRADWLEYRLAELAQTPDRRPTNWPATPRPAGARPTALAYAGMPVDLGAAAADCATDASRLSATLAQRQRVVEKFGLRPLVTGGTVTRGEWERLQGGWSAPQELGQIFGLGSPLQLR